MKKRLRKKTHRGEFTEWGRQLVATRNTKEAADAFQDAFILEAIEANGCYCGGCLSDDKVDVIVELGKMSGNPDAKFTKVTDWLDARPDIEGWRAGELFDTWHADYDDIEDRSEQHVGQVSSESAPCAAPDEPSTRALASRQMKHLRHCILFLEVMVCVGPALAQTARPEKMVRLNSAPLHLVLDEYSQCSARAVLLSPDVEASTNSLTFHFDGPADRYILELENSLLRCGVRLVSVGSNLVQAVTTNQDVRARSLLPPPLVPPRQSRVGTKAELRFLGAPIRMLLDEYAKITGASVRYEDQFPRTPITLRSRIQLSAHEQLQALECVLHMHGVLLVKNPDGSITAVLDNADEKEGQQSSAPHRSQPRDARLKTSGER